MRNDFKRKNYEEIISKINIPTTHFRGSRIVTDGLNSAR